LLRKIFNFITKNPDVEKTRQIISNDHIVGFLNTRYGVLGFGGLSRIGFSDEGYVVKYFKENETWKSNHIIDIKYKITDLKECDDGLYLCQNKGYYEGAFLNQKSIWIHFSCSDLLINNCYRSDLFFFISITSPVRRNTRLNRQINILREHFIEQAR
jgi:hypothetical protein